MDGGRFTNIKEKLALLRQRKLRETLPFGVTKHQYRVNPPISEEALRRFESEAGVELPEGYRGFLLKVGDGGAGPHYGLYPLSETWQYTDNLVVRGTAVPRSMLAQPCPFDGSEGELKYDDPNWDTLISPHEHYPWQGTLVIGDQGCTYHTMLVVSGRLRGCIGGLDVDGGPPWFPPQRDFLSWYEDWLDEQIATLIG